MGKYFTQTLSFTSVCVYVKYDVNYHFNLSQTLQICVNLLCNNWEPFNEFVCIRYMKHDHTIHS